MDSKPSTFVMILVLIAATFYSGFAIQLLWNWFIVPLGVMSLTLSHAIGICVFVSLLKLGTEKESKGDFWNQTLTNAYEILFLLFIGLFAYQFM